MNEIYSLGRENWGWDNWEIFTLGSVPYLHYFPFSIIFL